MADSYCTKIRAVQASILTPSTQVGAGLHADVIDNCVSDTLWLLEADMLDDRSSNALDSNSCAVTLLCIALSTLSSKNEPGPVRCELLSWHTDVQRVQNLFKDSVVGPAES
jgi:hypothetical protein